MTLPDTLRYLSLSATDPRSDGELVNEFLGTQEELAFAELLRRHGPTVYGVCRRILGDGPDADDAFQAVFLVLARKANAIRPPGMVGQWLYGVAVRTANKARVMNARRMNREHRSVIPTATTSRERDSETLAIIDKELAAIPAVYRAAFVACDINGRSRSEAARELGWPEGTVAARLAKARELLAARLRKRGVTLGASVFAAVAVPTAVSAETLMAVRELLAVGTASAVLPAAQQLSEEVLKSMGTFKLKLMAVMCLAIAFATGTALLVAGPDEKPGPRAERQQPVNAPVPKNLLSDPGLIWVADAKTGDLIAYTPDGEQERRLGLKDGHQPTDVPLGIVQDGQKFAFARPPKRGTGLTLHLRDLDSDDTTDTGIRMDFAARWVDVLRVPQFGWVTSGRYALLSDRKQEKPFAPLKYNLVDLETLTQTTVELPWDHIPTDVSRDGKTVLSVGVGPHGSRMSFYLCDTSGGKPILLPFQENISADSSPHVGRLAPDGHSILFKGSYQSGEKEEWQQGTFVFRIDDGGLSVVGREEAERDIRIGDRNLCWSPDGRRVSAGWMLLGYTKPRGGIRVCDPDGKNPSRAEVFRSTDTPGHLIGWHSTPRKNAPVPKAPEWKEAKPIEFDSGRVTSVAYSPSGKTLAVCRDNGKIDFYDPATRKHITGMDLGGEKGTTVGTVTALAFAPTPHPKNGDVFAVTHKHGVKFGTVGLGIFTDDAAEVEGIPPNIKENNFDPHRVAWLTNESLVATNGTKVWEQFVVKEGWGSSDWERTGQRGQQTVLAALPSQSKFYLTGGHSAEEANEVQIAARAPMSTPQARLTGHKSRPTAAAVAKDGKRIVTADAGGTLIVWEGDKLEFQEKSRVELGEGIVQLALAPNGKTVAVVRNFKKLVAVEWPPCQLELFVFELANPPAEPKPIWFSELKSRGFQNRATSLAFSPDGKTLLAAFADPYISDKDAKSLGVKVWELVPNK